MSVPEFQPVAIEDRFRFQCHSGVPCFNHCCRDLNQALTPYDVLMLRQHLGLTWPAFLKDYASVHIGPATGLPVVSLRFEHADNRRCPFVSDQGCRVYVARPSSCRLYPLARALRRSPNSHQMTAHFALVRETHCRGFGSGPRISVTQWIADQQLVPYFSANDTLLELIALKNRWGKGPLPPSQQQWVQMALYDLDDLKNRAAGHQLPDDLPGTGIDPLPDDTDDEQWLVWGMAWIKQVLTLQLKY